MNFFVGIVLLLVSMMLLSSFLCCDNWSFSSEERKKRRKAQQAREKQILFERKTYSQVAAVNTGLPLTGMLFKKRFSTDANPYYFASDDMDEIAACAWGQLYKQAMQYLEENGCQYYRMAPHYRMCNYYEGDNTVWINVEGVRV